MLEDRIYRDYVQALRSKDKHKSEFLSFIRAELRNHAIDLKEEKLDDGNVLKVLKKAKKRLQDAKESVVKAARADLIENAEKELAILDEYLPKPLQESELIAIIEQTISQVGASSLKDMGKVMREVLSKVGVRADSKKVSELLKTRLSP